MELNILNIILHSFSFWSRQLTIKLNVKFFFSSTDEDDDDDDDEDFEDEDEWED